MSTRLKILIVFLLLGIGTFVYVWFFVYNKPHKDIERSKPDYVLLASDLYDHYSNGLNTEIKNYNGKVLQISGVPSYVENNDSLTVVVFVFNSGMFGDEGIRCTLLPSYSAKAGNLNLEDKLEIKGYCSGYNDTDVILEQCSIID